MTLFPLSLSNACLFQALIRPPHPLPHRLQPTDTCLLSHIPTEQVTQPAAGQITLISTRMACIDTRLATINNITLSTASTAILAIPGIQDMLDPATGSSTVTCRVAGTCMHHRRCRLRKT